MAPMAVSPATAAGTEVRATVLSIGDGDTIRVQQGQQRITIRLACIDAPEMAQAPDGANARSYLQSRLRLGSSVTLRPQTVDRFGRTVAEVIGEVNLNLALVEDGMAFAYRRYLSQCNAKEYLDAEFRASRSRFGVWRVPGGITRPWDFRRGRSSGRSASAARSIPGGRLVRCSEIGSSARAQELLRQGHTYLDGNGDGEACESLR
jgi:endonuclease YncB( thermonuclease family)